VAKRGQLSSEERDREFVKHASKLMPFEQWKAIEDKTLRNALLRAWRQLFPDKEIREAWGLKYSKFYYYIKDLKEDNDNPPVDGAVSAARQKGPVILDADFHVVDEDGSKALVIQPTDGNIFAQQRIPIMHFDESGSPERIMKRLRAIAANLELEEGELELKIEIFRK